MDGVRWDWSLVTAPTTEPLTVPDAKAHARIRHDREDALIDGFIQAARQAAEQHMNRALLTQTRRVVLSAFTETIPLPFAAPLQNDADAVPSTAPVVTYYDADGVLQTLAASSYVVNSTKEPAQLERAPAVAWPSVQADRQYPVIVDYVCGWTDPDDIPPLILHGIKLWVSSLDADRLTESDASQQAAIALWKQFLVATPDPEVSTWR